MTLRRILPSLAVAGAFLALAVQPVLGAIEAKGSALRSSAIAEGTLAMTNSNSGAILSAAGLVPGATATGKVTIANTGTLAGIYRLSATTTGSALLASHLRLTIYKDIEAGTGTKLYEGSLAGFRSAELGTFTVSGESHSFSFRLSLPSSGADNALQGLNAVTGFTWSATQA